MTSEHSPTPAPAKDDPTRDYVAQAYLGLYGSTEMMRRTRRRIDWIASQCRGPLVLDVGCSEGILALLLAREGVHAIGVDTNGEAIAAAHALLENENDDVRKRVRLHHGDIESASLAAASADTLVISEVLEHLIAPERLLGRAIEHLREGGRLVITTPFGYHPDDDHRQEFGLAQFTDMVRALTDVEHIDIVDGYIRYVGILSARPGDGWARLGNRALVELGDDAARASQHVLHKHIDNHKKRIAALEKSAREREQQKKDHQTAANREEIQQLRLRIGTLDATISEQQKHDRERTARLNVLDKQLLQLMEQIATERSEKGALATRNAEMKSRSSELHAQLAALQQRVKDQRARLATFRDLTVALESRAQSFEDLCKQSATQLQGFKARLDTQKTSLDAQKKAGLKLSQALDGAKQRIAMLAASDKHYRHAVRELRSSVSFRLGHVFVRAAEQPLTGIVLLPFRFIGVIWHYLRTPRSAPAPRTVTMADRATPSSAKRAAAPSHEKRKAAPAASEQPTFPPFVSRVGQPPSGPIIATVLDEFSEQCFAPEAQLLPLSKQAWKQQLDAGKIDLLLVESAWRGNKGQWKGEINRCGEKTHAALPQLVAACRERGIPTVFWNKEDPLNFEQFIAAARLFDHVFTTDEALLARYREELGHDRVYALPFAAQPAIHNPSERRDEFDVAFAGSWFAEKHDARRAVLEPLLDAASGFDLQIFDRHSDLADPRYAFPAKYQRWIRKSLPYPQVLTAYRRFKVFLNANSVLESPSMFSRRVFEVLACGTPVVSTPSAGMDSLLPGLVRVARTEDDARRHLAELLENEETRRIEGHLGMREVFRSHTYRERLADVLARANVRTAASARVPKVSIILCTNRPENLANCLHNVRRQTHPDIELLLVLNRNGVDLDAVRAQFAELPQLQVLHVDESESLYTCLNTAIARCSGEIWSKMDDDNVYGDNYIADLVQAMRFTGADIVGKACYYTLLEHRNMSALRRMGPENNFVKFIQGGTITCRVDATRPLRWSEALRSGGDSQFLRDATALGLSIYSSDRFNFVSVRRGDEGSHTWTIADDDYLKRCDTIRDGIDLSRILI